MAHRTFTDPGGTEWQVWDVSPHVLEEDRRSGRDRRVPPPGERDPERRSADERRDREERRAKRRLTVRPGQEEGWLVFECADEKRRLLPVPPGWQVMGDNELSALCQSATPVRRRLA